MKYSEKRTDSKEYKEEYLRGINDLIKRKNEDVAKAREEYIKNVFTEPEKYRKDLGKLLGWPLDGFLPSDAALSAAMYLGSVPQQPPMMLAPASMRGSMAAAKSSAVRS